MLGSERQYCQKRSRFINYVRTLSCIDTVQIFRSMQYSTPLSPFAQEEYPSICDYSVECYAISRLIDMVWCVHIDRLLSSIFRPPQHVRLPRFANVVLLARVFFLLTSFSPRIGDLSAVLFVTDDWREIIIISTEDLLWLTFGNTSSQTNWWLILENWGLGAYSATRYCNNVTIHFRSLQYSALLHPY